MEPTFFFKAYLVVLVILCALDFVWLGLVTNKVYKKEFGDLARKKGDYFDPIWPVAILIYLIMAFGIVYFIIPKIIDIPLGLSSFIPGAILGFIIFSVYDLTNLTLLKNWSTKITILDIAWGTFTVSVSSVLASYILNLL